MVRIGPIELGALQKEVKDVAKELGDLNLEFPSCF